MAARTNTHLRLILSLSALLVACGGDSGQLASKQNIPKTSGAPKPAKQTQEAENEDNPVHVYSYQAVGKRDPFRSYLADLQESGELEQERKRSPTEMYERSQYALTGVMTGTAQPRALVQDPTGLGHDIRIGTRLGKTSGIVTRITSTGIVVTEEFRSPTGDKVRVPYHIQLPKEEKEMGLELQ